MLFVTGCLKGQSGNHTHTHTHKHDLNGRKRPSKLAATLTRDFTQRYSATSIPSRTTVRCRNAPPPSSSPTSFLCVQISTFHRGSRRMGDFVSARYKSKQQRRRRKKRKRPFRRRRKTMGRDDCIPRENHSEGTEYYFALLPPFQPQKSLP